MTSRISVIICSYTEKRWNELIAAVESAQRQTLPPEEIIVVVDRNPALLLRAREHIGGALVVENHGDKGLSGARNSGWSTAKGEIVAFLDDDAIAEPDWLEQLIACYAEADVVGVGGKIVPLWETRCPFWFPNEFNWVIGSTYRGMPARNARIRNVIGANMSMRKHILEVAGGFRESFGCDKDINTTRGSRKWFQHYAGDEETEFCIRISQQIPGSVWLYAVLAVVQHRVSAERTRWGYFMWRCYDEGLGKASLVKLHNTNTGLSSEKTYTFKTLPKGVVRGLADTFLHRDLTGVCRSAAIIVGLMMTTAGYIVGSISLRVAKPKADGVVASFQNVTASAKSHETLG